jgi:uncharacterized protein (DUF2236 family)
MSEEAVAELPSMAPGPVGPGQFPNRKDDGLFGPGSLTWRVYADPAAPIGMMAALLLQGLNPNMLRLFDAVSVNRSDPQGRATRTSQYILTTVFGDTAHAQAAGALVRRMHAHAKWTDPTSGEAIAADTPAWLAWTHNTLVWGVLHSCDVYGPSLTPSEQDRLVVEQLRAAGLVGLDPATLPATRAALDSYIDGQKGWLADAARRGILRFATAAEAVGKPSQDDSGILTAGRHPGIGARLGAPALRNRGPGDEPVARTDSDQRHPRDRAPVEVV